MRIRYHIADLYVSASTVKRRVQDPRVGAKGMRDGGNHGYAGGRSHAAYVREEHMADDEDFGNQEGTTRPCLRA